MKAPKVNYLCDFVRVKGLSRKKGIVKEGSEKMTEYSKLKNLKGIGEKQGRKRSRL
jgi:hypothetical protein